MKICDLAFGQASKADSINDILQQELSAAIDTYNTSKALMAETTIVHSDVADTSSQLEQRALAEAAMSRASIKIGQIRNILLRAEKGAVDECEECGGGVPIQRIILTMSSKCVDCQEVHDAQSRHYV